MRPSLPDIRGIRNKKAAPGTAWSSDPVLDYLRSNFTKTSRSNKKDGLVKSPKSVTPAKAGVQNPLK
jgi:hypothetical protein